MKSFIRTMLLGTVTLYFYAILERNHTVALVIRQEIDSIDDMVQVGGIGVLRKINVFVFVGALMILFTLSCTKDTGAGLKVDSDLTTLCNQAENLLLKYNLNPKGVAKEKTFKLEGNFELLNEVSKDIRFDLSGFKGKEVKALVYNLKETSQYNNGPVKAYVLFDKGIIGAYVVLYGYVPGVVSLNDRSAFMPKSLTVSNLEFNGVEKVEIAGPWEQSQWKYQIIQCIK